MKIFKKNYTLFLIILGLNWLLAALIIRAMYPVHFTSQNYLFADLNEFNIKTPFWSSYFISTLNLLLIWLIFKKFFSSRTALIPALIYSISPWNYYLAVFGSFYLFLLCLLLFTYFGILLLKQDYKLGIILLF